MITAVCLVILSCVYLFYQLTQAKRVYFRKKYEDKKALLSWKDFFHNSVSQGMFVVQCLKTLATKINSPPSPLQNASSTPNLQVVY